MRGIGKMDKKTIIKLFESSVIKEKFIYPKDFSDLKKSVVEDFCAFCEEKLGISEMPEIRLVNERGSEQMSTGSYTPKVNKVVVLGGHRAILDVLRSIGHELTHRKQDEDGELDKIGPQGDHKSSDDISDVGTWFEDSANAKGGALIKEFSRKYGKVSYEKLFTL